MSSSGPLCFYGDDFTGATAHLSGFHEVGLKALMFLRTPTLEEAARHLQEEDVLGIAGISRSLVPAAMEQEIRPAFSLFRALGARQVHYKICSTFDSSPQFGSIGRAIEIGRDCFGSAPVPVVPACPSFGRYVAFGNLFAKAGDTIHRLDRHPTMSRHPATPMNEADLGRHLAAQSTLASASVDWRAVRAGGAVLAQAWRDAVAHTPGTVVFDTLEDDDLDRIAALLWEVSAAQTLFCVAAQGLAGGMGRYMARAGTQSRAVCPPVADCGPMLVLSGSAAPQNAEQIARAMAAGWVAIRVDLTRALSGSDRAVLAEQISQTMLTALHAGRSVVVYTAQGPDDPAIDQVRGLSTGIDASVAEITGTLFARWAQMAIQRVGLRRFVLAGGDTSSLAMRNMDAYALRIAATARHGGRLCRLLSTHAWLDGVEVMLKGGQVGGPDAFVDAANASAWRV